MYYADKLESLKDIFGTQDIYFKEDNIYVNGSIYPVIDDVIILLPPSQYPSLLKKRIEGQHLEGKVLFDPAKDIQFTFGEEWKRFPNILPEHKREFSQYFNLVDISELKDFRICDLGCGIGRWSYFLKDSCRELVLVDFSDAIFVARQNLKSANNAIFFMGDLRCLPFRDFFADFLLCLGVLHHLPTNALQEVKKLKRYANILLIYLYYALDNHPSSYRVLLTLTTAMRMLVSKVRNPVFRMLFVELMTTMLYCPLIGLGKIFNLAGRGRIIPLYEYYNGMGLKRIRQDVYDRFFTSIEQRFSRKEILALRDHFNDVIVSESLPYWHFVCKNKQEG